MPPTIQIGFNESISHSVGDVRLSREITLLDILSQFGIESKADSFAVTVYFRNLSPFLQEIPGFFYRVDQQERALGLREFLDLDLSVSRAERPGATGSTRKTKRRSRGDSVSVANEPEFQASSFTDDPETYRQIMEQTRNSQFLAGETATQAESFRKFLNFQHFGTAILDRSSGVKFSLKANTDSPTFLNWIDARVDDDTVPCFENCEVISSVVPSKVDGFDDKELLKSQFVLKPKIRIAEIPPAENGSAGRFWEGWLVLNLAKMDELDYSTGYTAIDFGNSSSAICVASKTQRAAETLDTTRLDPSARDSKPRNSAVKSDPTIESAVLLRDYTAAEDADVVAKCDWKSGKNAITDKRPEGLVLGPKRWISANMDSGTLSISFNHQNAQIPRDLPSELLLSTMLKESFYEHRTRPGSLAVTYPSTYSSAEVKRLQNVLLRSFDRALGYSRYDDQQTLPRPLFLDEATAAAFYFLYRDFFNCTGRIEAFNYLYPNGVNVCVTDFGGGTTDVGLVHCRLEKVASSYQDETDESSSWVMRIHVLGRTGERLFGGDNITIAVFRFLKASIAKEVKGSKSLQDVFSDPETFLQRYEENFDEIDSVVPTSFDRSDVYSRKSLDARELTREFWTYAEEVKKWLADEIVRQRADTDEASVSHPSRFPDIKEEWGIRWDLAEGDASYNVRAAVDEELSENIVERVACIDSQIRGTLEQIIKNTNLMVRERLTKPLSERSEVAASMRMPELPPGSHIDRLYVVGNAARYPLVHDVIQNQFELPIVNHEHKSDEPDWENSDPHLGRIVFDKQNLKSSVVKGALLAKHVSENFKEVLYDWDKDLVRRLPYSLCMDSQAHNPLPIYHEGEHYDAMLETAKPLPDPSGQEKEKQKIVFDRKWPGDPEPSQNDSRGGWKPFLEFKFDRPLVGPLQVQYIEDDRRGIVGYKIDDIGLGKTAFGEVIHDPDDVRDLPPMQRGDL